MEAQPILTFEITIDGRTIGSGSVTNIRGGSPYSDCEYSWEFYIPMDQLRKGVVVHKKQDGPLALIRKILDAIGGRQVKQLMDRFLYTHENQDIPVEGFIDGGNLTIRTINCLRKHFEDKRVIDLVSMSEKEFKQLKDIGKHTLKDMKEWLAENNLSFRPGD